MRKIVYSLSVSLDGFFEGPNGEIDWHRVDGELHAHMNERFGRYGAFLTGRVTHDLMADYWPAADRNPDSSPEEVEFASIWRDVPKVVFTRGTTTSTDWNTTVRHGVDPDEIRALKGEPGGDMVVGGPNLAAAFRDLGLIDEYTIYVHPVLVGSGNPAFPETDELTGLDLVGTKTFGNGVVLLHYRTT
jgi:dihydrofolate reductase